MINRREALSRVAIIMGGTILGADAFASGIRISTTNIALTKMDIAFLNEVAETILPKTKTPGAKEANVGAFMQIMVNDCYETKDQAIFMEGIKKLDEASKKMNGKSFMLSTPAQKRRSGRSLSTILV